MHPASRRLLLLCACVVAPSLTACTHPVDRQDADSRRIPESRVPESRAPESGAPESSARESSVRASSGREGEPEPAAAPDTTRPPPDFAVRYHYDRGAIPPSGHYRYTIQAGPGRALAFGFEGGGVEPYGQHDLTLTIEDQRRLYALVVAERVLARGWNASDAVPVGGDIARLTITANGQRIEVPNELDDRADALTRQRLVRALDALVPHSVWDVELARQPEGIAALIRARRAADRRSR